MLDEDFVYMSFANKALGSTPYIILLDRWAHAVGPVVPESTICVQPACAVWESLSVQHLGAVHCGGSSSLRLKHAPHGFLL